MKKLLLSIATVLILLPSLSTAGAIGKQKDKKKDKTEQVKPKLTKYQKLFKDKNVSVSSGGFMTVKQVGEKLYLEFPLSILGRDFISGQTIGKSSFSERSHSGQQIAEPKLITFSLEDSTLVLSEKRTVAEFEDNSQRSKELLEHNFANLVVSRHPVLAYTPDSSAVVVDLSKVFKEVDPSWSPIPVKPGKKVHKIDSKKTTFKGINVFDDNMSVNTEISGTYNPTTNIFNRLPDVNFTIEVVNSLILLPEQQMTPRVSDLRVGTFLTSKNLVTNKQDNIKRYTLARRWALVPKDTEAYLSGKLSDPVKPIVFYLDPLFPEEWKEPLRKGVLSWNKAFEGAGFSNAVQIKDYPTDDPDFNPANLKYSCIRYVPVATQNAMGPSWSDTRSGEIISAAVYIYNDISKLIANWRFVQTAAVDEQIRSGEISDELLSESLTYIVAHEVGHCLGLMHNMGASASYPVDSLRSASFTQEYGTTPSIMDYARFNYVAQIGDKGVKLTPPELGVYDYYAIKWLYTWSDKSLDVQNKELEAMVDQAQKNPMLRYKRQQIISRYDPKAIEEDLGDDAIKASDYGIKNLKYIMANMDKWLDKTDIERRRELYAQITQQYYRYVRNVMYYVGGIDLSDPKTLEDNSRHNSIPADVQRKAALWVMSQLSDCTWLEEGSLVYKLQLDRYSSIMFSELLSENIHQLGQRVVLSSNISDDPYTLEEYLDDVYTCLWDNYVAREPLNESVKIFQTTMPRFFVTSLKLIGVVQPKEKTSLYNDAYAPSENDIICYRLDDHCTIDETTSLGSGYGWQISLNTASISDATTQYLAFATRVKELIEKRMPEIDAAEKPYYQSILFSLNRILKDESALINMFSDEK